MSEFTFFSPATSFSPTVFSSKADMETTPFSFLLKKNDISNVHIALRNKDPIGYSYLGRGKTVIIVDSAFQK